MTTNRRITTTSAKDLLGYTVGFDELLDRLSQPKNENYPPYNLIRVDGSNQFIVEVAVAGFTKEDITVESENSILTISGTKTFTEKEIATPRIYRHRGLSWRDFSHKFAMPDDTVVKSVKLENGLLTIVLERIVPNRHKKKVYDL